jgi:hypothetical protein
MFAGGDQHRVLNGIQNDLRIDAFFFTLYLDGLKNRFQSSLLQYPNISGWLTPGDGLPIKLKIGLLNLL